MKILNKNGLPYCTSVFFAPGVDILPIFFFESRFSLDKEITSLAACACAFLGFPKQN